MTTLQRYSVDEVITLEKILMIEQIIDTLCEYNLLPNNLDNPIKWLYSRISTNFPTLRFDLSLLRYTLTLQQLYKILVQSKEIFERAFLHSQAY